MNNNLTQLIENIIQLQKQTGFADGTINISKRVYKRLINKAVAMGCCDFTEDLAEAFMADTNYQNSDELCYSRYCLHNQCIARLIEYQRTGKINWSDNVKVKRIVDSPGTEKFRLIFANYLQLLKSDGKHTNTIDSYRNISCLFLKFCESQGVYGVSDIQSETIVDFFIKLRSHWSENSIRTAASGLRSFGSYISMPARTLAAIPKRCIKVNSILEPLTKEEESILWEYLKNGDISLRDKSMVMLIYITGIRAVDVLALTLDDIKWEKDFIHVIQNKTGKEINFPMPAAIGNALAEYIINERPVSEKQSVFLRKTAPYTPLMDHSACYSIIHKILVDAGIQRREVLSGSRLLRHNSATRLLKAGVKLPVIAAALGHTDEMLIICVLPMPKGGNL
jgi:site-specific recombinase XerD